MHIKEELNEEVRRLAGDRYKRDGIVGYDRRGKQQGSVYIKDQRIDLSPNKLF